ncbi:N-acetyltransferase family protein [Macellibacteroides fermentans]|uniref:N-acetyltransferase family protein n=1 Tax=Macellibacteroides fermentans TaxID=879969 RepID=UPI00406C582D
MATAADAPGIREIYAPYIMDTAITFEYEIPTISELSARISDTIQRYPYLVAVEKDCIVGFAYASASRIHLLRMRISTIKAWLFMNT